MTSNKKEQICTLLKGIETGDASSVAVVNEEKYIQHNPQTHEGSEGLAALFKRLSKTSPRVNIVRIFEDADFIFAHTEYDFATRNIGFEIFRFENDQAVEHWDNIQQRIEPNASGHSMVDGEIDVTDRELTESNRKVISSFVEDTLNQGNFEKLHDYINQKDYTEHHSDLNDAPVEYKQCHRILAEGNFVLSVCEGNVNHVHSSFFDLYRLKHGKIVEHWNTTETIPPPSEWKNDNGKF